MKIFFSIGHIGLGGTQRVTINLINWIIRNTSHNVTLIIKSKSKESEYKYPLNGIKYINLPDEKINKIISLRKILKKETPDILVSMGMPESAFDSIASFGLGIKYIISERNDPNSFNGKKTTILISRFLACLADGFVFQTKDAMDFYNRKYYKNGTIIPNPLLGIDEMPLSPFSGRRKKEIVSVGRLNSQKNFSMLIDAFNIFNKAKPGYSMIIYGEGPEKNNLLNKIKELNLDGIVILHGAISNVVEMIYESSLFVLSSDFEGMPNALMEAMALGIPCIATDCSCGGPKSLIENNRTGILTPVGDCQMLAQHMINLLNNSDKLKKISEGAFQIREKLNVANISNMWLSYMEKVLNK